MPNNENIKSGYMAKLDNWTAENILNPIVNALMTEGCEEGLSENIEQEIMKAVRSKVLESYKNGVEVGAKAAVKGVGERSRRSYFSKRK